MRYLSSDVRAYNGRNQNHIVCPSVEPTGHWANHARPDGELIPTKGSASSPSPPPRRERTLRASAIWLFALPTHIVPLFTCLRRMGVPPALLHVLPSLGDLFEGSVPSEPVANQPATDHGPGATDPTPAVDIDRPATVQGVVDGVEDCCHLPGAAWDGHVDDGMMLPPDLDAFGVRLFLSDSHVRR